MTPNDDQSVLAEASRKRTGLVSEMFGLLNQTKKWWLAPIIVCIVALGLLVLLSGTAAAPFIYTLF